MADSNSENKPEPVANSGIEPPNFIGLKEPHQEWFLNYLKYQAQSVAFFEYIIMEDENGRK